MLRLRVDNPQDLLVQSLTMIVRGCPPALPWAAKFRGQTYRGLFLGPTSIAYLFLWLSKTQQDLIIEGKTPGAWCNAYLDCGQDSVLPIFDKSCGITNEYLSFHAVRASATRDTSYVKKVLEALTDLRTDPTFCECFNGRAGALYLLRMIRTWFPESTEIINEAMKPLIEHLLGQEPWFWSGRQYCGAVHGEIGILTQIVLSCPSYAGKFEAKLSSLLDLQDIAGNWPVVPGEDMGLVQFCHGAPGFVISLVALRPYFTAHLQARIDAAVERGRMLTWERGLLTKEPNICHGITGNALALAAPERDHFLGFATPEQIKQGITDGRFEEDEDPYGLLWGEAGRAWVWMSVANGSMDGIIPYTDV